MINNQLYKKCTWHSEFFPNESEWFLCDEKYFYKNKSNSTDGLHNECKRCSIQKELKWEKEHPERLKINRQTTYSKPERKQYLTTLSEERRNNGKYYKWSKTKSGQKSCKKHQQNYLHKKHNISRKEWTACKDYFKNEKGEWYCAYCGFLAKDHYRKYGNTFRLNDLHKEHVDHNGSTLLNNCVPSCNQCNTTKHTKALEEFYNEDNPNYTKERYDKIIKWISEDYKLHIEPKHLHLYDNNKERS